MTACMRQILPAVMTLAMVGAGARAQEPDGAPVDEQAPPPVIQEMADPNAIEEVVVLGRFKAAATDIVSERIDSDVPVDLLDAEGISRVGDSDVAQALRRVPGLTVAQGKFVYVRGLGERYSSALLNGAAVPSPDLTRNVLPLDIFPADIIDALAVQKGFSPEMPAAFGGGNVDIRTKQVPEDRVFSVELSTGWNTGSGDDGLSYHGGGDDRIGEDDGTRALSGTLREAIQTYRGNISSVNIFNTLRRAGGTPTLAHAEALNRQLATALNRDIDIGPEDLSPDVKGEITGGYRWFLGERWEFGFLALGSYANEWRNRNRINRNVANPETDFSRTQRTVESVNITGTANFGLRFTDDHEIGTMSMLLRNTEDDASFSLTCQQGQFNDCADDNPTQGRVADIRFEQRELIVNQVRGEHTLGDDTYEVLPFLERLQLLRDTTVTWYYSEAEATTDIPNEVRVGSLDVLDAPYGNVVGTSIRSSGTAGDFRFSDLADDVETWGSDVTVPLRAGAWDIELSGGYDYARKARSYEQISLGIGSTTPGFSTIAEGPPSQVFSDTNLMNPENGFITLLGVGGFGLESYYAAQITEATYGKFDILIDETWRISGGARWENFIQVSVPVDLLEFGGSRIPFSAQEIADATINEEDIYPSLALTYIRPGFWSDEFQLRFSWGETVARPDLREVSQSTYIDPLTEARVRGNPFLVPSTLTNFDLRAEWFWDSGDNLTASLFYKDVTDPIETLQGAATEDNIVFNFVNADAVTIYGAEFEGLKSLGFLQGWLGEWIDQFYIAGNVTLSDSELDIRAGGLAGNITNTSRRMTQQSEWVVNVQLGFDSFNGKHGATLVYNSVGERIFFAGIESFDDAYEQPFHSLDFVYSWFATENLTLKLRIRNLLDQGVEIEQDGVTILEQDVGATALFDIRWEL